MTQFIKVGNKYINLESITEVMDELQDGGKVIVFFAEEDAESFVGENADALRFYFNSIATDIVAIHQAKLESEKRNKDWIELLNTHAAFLCRPFWQVREATKLMDDDEDDFKGEAGANRIEEYIKAYHPDWQVE